MIPIKITVIDIHPSTHVRSTKNEGWLLADSVTYEYLTGLDEKRLLTHGKRGTLAARKKQLEVNRAHKEEIKAWVVRNEFKMPHGHAAVWFYVPMPASWRPKQRAQMCYTVHQNTPDLDNYLKQLYDAIMPRKNRMKKEKGIDDRKIHNYAAFKVWVPYEEACMKVLEYDSVEFMEVFNHGHPACNKELPFIPKQIITQMSKSTKKAAPAKTLAPAKPAEIDNPTPPAKEPTEAPISKAFRTALENHPLPESQSIPNVESKKRSTAKPGYKQINIPLLESEIIQINALRALREIPRGSSKPFAISIQNWIVEAVAEKLVRDNAANNITPEIL